MAFGCGGTARRALLLTSSRAMYDRSEMVDRLTVDPAHASDSDLIP